MFVCVYWLGDALRVIAAAPPPPCVHVDHKGKARVVVPMARLSAWALQPIKRLNPTARIADVEYVLVFQELAAIPSDELGARIGSLAKRRVDLVAALDLLFTGL